MRILGSPQRLTGIGRAHSAHSAGPPTAFGTADTLLFRSAVHGSCSLSRALGGFRHSWCRHRQAGPSEPLTSTPGPAADEVVCVVEAVTPTDPRPHEHQQPGPSGPRLWCCARTCRSARSAGSAADCGTDQRDRGGRGQQGGGGQGAELVDGLQFVLLDVVCSWFSPHHIFIFGNFSIGTDDPDGVSRPVRTSHRGDVRPMSVVLWESLSSMMRASPGQ